MAHLFGTAVLVGGSLLASSPSQEPVLPRSAAEASAQTATPFLYSIEGEAVSGFLYGTVHLPDERVHRLPPVVESALDGADAFYAEIEATAAADAKVQTLATMEPGVTLDGLVDAETWSKIEARFVKAGQPVAMAQALGRFEPWAFGALIPMLDYMDELAKRPALDKALYQRAQRAGKVVGGLETVEEQVAAFSGFDRKEQIQMLKDSLATFEEYDAQGRKPMEEMVQAWLNGNGDALVKLLDDGFGKDPALRARAEDALLWKRNARFADRIEAKLKAAPGKTSFFAVGALHLPDAPKPKQEAPKEGEAPGTAKTEMARKVGLVTLLRERGYTVKRIRNRSAVPVEAAGAGK